MYRISMAVTVVGLLLSGAAPIAAQAPPSELVQPACQTHDAIMRISIRTSPRFPPPSGCSPTDT